MSRYSASRDLTMRQHAVNLSLGMPLKWMCGHQALSGQRRRVPGLQPILWRCAACVEAGKEKAAA